MRIRTTVSTRSVTDPCTGLNSLMAVENLDLDLSCASAELSHKMSLHFTAMEHGFYDGLARKVEVHAISRFLET